MANSASNSSFALLTGTSSESQLLVEVAAVAVMSFSASHALTASMLCFVGATMFSTCK